MEAGEENANLNHGPVSAQNQLLEKMEKLMTTKLTDFENKMSAKQQELSDTQINKMQDITADKYAFKRKGNEEQFKHNSKVSSSFREAGACLVEPTLDSIEVAKGKINEGISLINQRQKLVKLADSSELGWRVVNEYTQHQLASDSDDGKKMYKAEARPVDKGNPGGGRSEDQLSRSRYGFHTAAGHVLVMRSCWALAVGM
jgi:hypothetical protein